MITSCASDGADPSAQEDGAADGAEDSDDGEDVGSGETIVLRYVSQTTEDNPHSQAMTWWADELSSRTQGRVVVEHYYGGALCPQVEILSCLSDGRADLGMVAPGFTPSELPLSTVSTLPFVSNQPGVYSQALNQMYAEDADFQSEWESQNVKVLVFPAVGTAWTGTSRPIEGVDDLRGLRVREIGFATQAFGALGASPTAIPTQENYQALELGTLDAFLTTLDSAVALQFFEVTDYWYETGTGTFTTVTNPAMSLSRFDSLPDDIQATILEVSAEMRDRFLTEWFLPSWERDCETALASGAELAAMPDEVVAAMEAEVADPLRDQWITQASEAGAADPAGFLSRLLDLVDEYESTADADELGRTTLETCLDVRDRS